MRGIDTILDIHRKRGAKGLPLERVYKHLFDPDLFLRAYGKIYRNAGAMTKGTFKELPLAMPLLIHLRSLEFPPVWCRSARSFSAERCSTLRCCRACDHWASLPLV